MYGGENHPITDGNYDKSLAVKCINGTFVGRKKENIIAYRGIPYVGQQPVGKLRWKAPVDVTPRDGVYEAFYNAKSAFGNGQMETGSLYYMDEDCLYLNVFKQDGAAGKKPVMVWIHGGGFTQGSTVNPLYDGHNFVKNNGDVILVTTVLSYFFSPLLLKGLMKSERVYEAAVSYVNWRVPGLFFAFMTALFRAFYVGTRETASLTLNSLVMVGCNVLLDWVLIFGHWGAPAMGIQGAALASTISEGISLVFFVIWSVATVDKMYGLQKLVKPIWEELKQLFSTASWVMVEYVLNISVWLLFFLFIEHLGEEELAVANIVRSISEVPLLAFFALCPHLIIGLFTDIPSLVQASVPTLWVMCAATVLTLPWNVYLQSVAGTGDTRVCLRFDVVALCIYAVYCTVVISILKSSVAVCWTADGVYSLCIWVQGVLYLHGK